EERVHHGACVLLRQIRPLGELVDHLSLVHPVLRAGCVQSDRAAHGPVPTPPATPQSAALRSPVSPASPATTCSTNISCSNWLNSRCISSCSRSPCRQSSERRGSPIRSPIAANVAHVSCAWRIITTSPTSRRK